MQSGDAVIIRFRLRRDRRGRTRDAAEHQGLGVNAPRCGDVVVRLHGEIRVSYDNQTVLHATAAHAGVEHAAGRYGAILDPFGDAVRTGLPLGDHGPVAAEQL